MCEVYEYRRAPSYGIVWVGFASVVGLLSTVAVTQAQQLSWVAFVVAAVTIAAFLTPKTVFGIRINHRCLVLSAWRAPRSVPLADIAYLRAMRSDGESNLLIVLKDGSEERTFIGDLPDLETLAAVMAQRGIALRHSDHALSR